jgi:hypothetical protein
MMPIGPRHGPGERGRLGARRECKYAQHNGGFAILSQGQKRNIHILSSPHTWHLLPVQGCGPS